LNNVVEPESGVTILFNIVDSYEQCGQQNIVQSCFHQYCINLSVFTRVKECAHSITPSLTCLLNKSLKQASLPSEWKLSNIIPLHKKGINQEFC
jgi:hypothetical protein